MNNRLSQNRWSPIADYALLLGSGAGAVASIATQNAAVATVPMTALVAMGLLNRRRIDRYLKQSDQTLAELEGHMVTELSIMGEQVSAMPSPETITQFQRSAMDHSDRGVVQCADALAYMRQEFDQRLRGVEAPDLSHLHQENAQLQDQYTNLSSTVANLSKQIERLSHLPRMEATETDVSQLKTEMMQLRVSLESLGSESKTAQATLQDAVRHLDRRLRQLPNSSDPNLLKGEVRELVKAVSDLVPRREFAALTEKMQTMQEGQESLRQTLDRLRSLPAGADQNGHYAFVESSNHEDVADLKAELIDLAEGLQQVETRLEDIAVPLDIKAEIRGTTATYLSSLQWQLSQLEQQTEDLMDQQQSMVKVPSSRTPGNIPAAEVSAPPSNMQWLMALRGDTVDENWTAIDRALFQALDEVSERLVVVWPWTSAITLNERLTERFEEILDGGCRLEVGWCHPGDRHEGWLLKAINRQWQLKAAQRQLLKSTLNQLLPLKQKYPELFAFKILGTKEQFIVCDRDYAIVGVEGMTATSSIFPQLDLRVRTTEGSVIDQLLHRFDHPDALPEDTAAYFNRAVTRYDLRDTDGAIADFSHVLELDAKDAVTLNNRGTIWVDKKQPHKALADLDRAIKCDARSYAARCNRGWLRANKGEFDRAIADFDWAIQADGTAAIPFFYRGTARQSLGDTMGAIVDYTKAIENSPQTALPYCYRGAAYQRQSNIPNAIADLEMAASLLHAQGDHRSLGQVTRVLSSLKQAELTQPLKLHSA